MEEYLTVFLDIKSEHIHSLVAMKTVLKQS